MMLWTDPKLVEGDPSTLVEDSAHTAAFLVDDPRSYILKYYNGAAWVPVLVRLKKWDGVSAWVVEHRKVRVFSTGAWLQVNPNYP